MTRQLTKEQLRELRWRMDARYGTGAADVVAVIDELATLRNILSFGPTLPEHVSSRVYAVVMDAIREADAEQPMKRAQLVVTAIRDVLMQEQGIDTKQERCIYDI